jgi:peptidyl-prolyl cis-trans isomerase C
MPLLKHRDIWITFCLFFVTSLLLYGCGKKEAAESRGPRTKEILAMVGEDAITIDAYKEEIAMLPPQYRSLVGLHKSEFLESLISKQLLLQEVKKRNLQNSENVKRLFKKVKEEMVIQELIDREITDKVVVTDSEIEAYYYKNQDKYAELAKTRVSHILVDSEVLAKKILLDLKDGKEFENLAKEYSLDAPTKDKGGELGYFEKGMLLPDFEQACDRIKVGEISDIVKTELGYHIIKVLNRKEAGVKALEDAKGDIKNELRLDKEISVYDNLLQELQKNQKVVINHQLLESLDLSQIETRTR